MQTDLEDWILQSEEYCRGGVQSMDALALSGSGSGLISTLAAQVLRVVVMRGAHNQLDDGQDATRSRCARTESQSVMRTTDASATEFISKILAAFVSLNPKTTGTAHELAANIESILP